MKKLIIFSLLLALTGCNVSIHTLPKTITPSVIPTATYEATEGTPIIEQVWDGSFLPTDYAYRETLTIDGFGHWKVVRSSAYEYPRIVASGDIGSEGVDELIADAYTRDSYSDMRFVDLFNQYGESNFRTITLNMEEGALEVVDPGSDEEPCEVFDDFAEAIARATVELPLND